MNAPVHTLYRCYVDRARGRALGGNKSAEFSARRERKRGPFLIDKGIISTQNVTKTCARRALQYMQALPRRESTRKGEKTRQNMPESNSPLSSSRISTKWSWFRAHCIHRWMADRYALNAGTTRSSPRAQDPRLSLPNSSPGFSISVTTTKHPGKQTAAYN